jgi:ubiquinone/menaquinone biosynthesis C-methylase UbiE
VHRDEAGRLRFRLRCLDKLRYEFRGDESLLDSGCGDGGVARLLRDRVGDVTAIDVVPSAGWRSKPGLRFLVADAEALPFEPDSFDVVHSKDCLHHMGAPERALAEYHRVLKSGGTALIIEANRYNPFFYPHMTLGLGHEHFTQTRFRSLVQTVFTEPRFGSFEAHYAPPLNRTLRVQNAIEETLERLRPFRPLLSYNFAVAER